MSQSGDSSAATPEAYNKVFEFYAEDTDNDIDLVGFVAYALYKRQKRDWILKHLEDKHRRPTDEEISAVITSYLTDDMRRTLRDRASDLLSQYAEEYVSALEPSIRENAVNSESLVRVREIKEEIARQTGFWQQVKTGLAASVIWTGILIVVLAGAALFGTDLSEAWRTLNPSTN
ncbi:hypothetical protein [Stappia sp.]|uniref:hypothetical protein n=1 Tax=Stappia sp. TaxID=1870903 RepID=UPI0032D93220